MSVAKPGASSPFTVALAVRLIGIGAFLARTAGSVR